MGYISRLFYGFHFVCEARSSVKEEWGREESDEMFGVP